MNQYQHRIVLFNGPPRCGKDTAALACIKSEDLNGYFRVFDRMSMPCKRAFAGTVNQNLDGRGNVMFWEEHKEDIISDFGVSYRQWQIDFSEQFMKPLYGNDIFGKLFLGRMLKQDENAVFFVPDCGFDIEYHTLIHKLGPTSVLVIKIFRPGTDFRSDSRSYLKVGSFGDKRDTETVIHINNAGTEDEFKRKVITRVSKWLGGTP